MTLLSVDFSLVKVNFKTESDSDIYLNLLNVHPTKIALIFRSLFI